MHGELARSANPTTPVGEADSSGLATTDLALATVTRVKRRISDLTPICLFAFYSNNGVVGFMSSETTEPIVTIATPRSDEFSRIQIDGLRLSEEVHTGVALLAMGIRRRVLHTTERDV